MHIASTTRKQSIDMNDEKRKMIKIFNRVEALDTWVKELEQSMADTEEIKQKLNEVNEANAKLQDAYNTLKTSFEILGKEKTEVQLSEKETTDRAIQVESQLAFF